MKMKETKKKKERGVEGRFEYVFFLLGFCQRDEFS